MPVMLIKARQKILSDEKPINESEISFNVCIHELVSAFLLSFV